MKNWMVELEKHIGAEDAKLVIQLVAGVVIVTAIFMGNWHLFVQ